MLALAGCGGGADDGVACTLEVRPAVELTIVDAAGAPIGAVNVSFRIDDGPVNSLTCDTQAACAFGHETPGSYVVAVGRSGYVTGSLTLTVGRDACHVITERRTLTLMPSP